MNKLQLVQKVSEKTHLKKSAVKLVLESVLSTIVETLTERQTVQLMGFGSFKVKRRKERVGHLPGSEEPITLAAMNIAAFSAGKTLRAAIQDRR